MGKPPLPREHGTARGRGQHVQRGEDVCEACAEAWRVYQNARSARIRAEQAERRARWAAEAAR